MLRFLFSIALLVWGGLILAGVAPSDNVVLRILSGLLLLFFGVFGLVLLARGTQPRRRERTARRGPLWAGGATDGHSAGVGFGIGTPVDPLDTCDEEGPGIEFRR
jgi:hypothetical protein